jgi:predicted RNA-binding protein associated with RNAse of E/G family
MITVIKQDPYGNAKIQYQGEIVRSLPQGVVIQAYWIHAAKDLGYTVFEPGDLFLEYYYTDRWFNIFAIEDRNGTRKGWYCNITEPATITDEYITQVDLFLDVWVDPRGVPLMLDEDEFAAASMLSTAQREGARSGLQALLQLLERREEVFMELKRP